MLHGSPRVYVCSHWHQILTPQGHAAAVIGGHPNLQFFGQPMLACKWPSPHHWGSTGGPIGDARS